MADNDAQKDKYVTFKSGSEYFGIKIEYVNEIIVYQEITESGSGRSRLSIMTEPVLLC